jgi:hypothetical protein
MENLKQKLEKAGKTVPANFSRIAGKYHNNIDNIEKTIINLGLQNLEFLVVFSYYEYTVEFIKNNRIIKRLCYDFSNNLEVKSCL